MSNSVAIDRPVYSSLLESDPDLQDIVVLFTQEMSERIETLKKYWRDKDYPGLQRFTHQLKGAGGSHGFAPLSVAASNLENCLKTKAEESEIEKSLDALIAICRRVTADHPPD